LDNNQIEKKQGYRSKREITGGGEPFSVGTRKTHQQTQFKNSQKNYIKNYRKSRMPFFFFFFFCVKRIEIKGKEKVLMTHLDAVAFHEMAIEEPTAQ
jgi:hypothetical protein